MNMVKEGIQTRRRKQKMGNGSSKAKTTKQSNTNTPSKETKQCLPQTTPNYDAMRIRGDYLEPRGNYSYREFHSQEFTNNDRPCSSALGQHQRFVTAQSPIISASAFEPELYARQIIPSQLASNISSHLAHDEEQHLKVVRTSNLDQL